MRHTRVSAVFFFGSFFVVTDEALKHPSMRSNSSIVRRNLEEERLKLLVYEALSCYCTRP
jgi:hypothetical protein